jgi:hypothetical protein
MSIQGNSNESLSFAKGAQPSFFKDPAVDTLYAMVVTLTEEISVLRERLDTHERLAEQNKPSTCQAVEDYVADQEIAECRDEARRKLVQRVMRPVKQLQYAAVSRVQKRYESDMSNIISNG